MAIGAGECGEARGVMAADRTDEEINGCGILRRKAGGAGDRGEEWWLLGGA